MIQNSILVSVFPPFNIDQEMGDPSDERENAGESSIGFL
jgi:hypothetical protein